MPISRPSASPWGSPVLEETARRAAAWEWAEGKLYEIVGAWARAAAAPACKLYFDSASQHHAWRAQLWHGRLRGGLAHAYSPSPVPSPLPSPSVQGPPTPGRLPSGAKEALSALSATEGDVGRLAVHCRVVLARTVSGYRAWQEMCGPYADRPVARALSQAVADVTTDWQEGSFVLARALDKEGATAATEAAEASARADTVLSAWGFW
jgi:hypothetical protein